MLVSLAGCGNAPSTAPPAGSGTDTPAAGADDDAGPAPADAEKGALGILMPSLAFDFQAQMAAGVRRAAEENGYEYQEVDYNRDDELMLSGLETLVASNCKAVMTIAINTQAAEDFFAGHPEIHAFTHGASMEAEARTIDEYSVIGGLYLEALENFIAETGATGGQMASLWLENSQIEGTPDYENRMVLNEMFAEFCAEKGIEYVSDQFAVDAEMASSMTEQLLNAYPDLRYIFCMNNGFAISAANEIASAKPDSSEYFVFASEGDAETFRLIAAEDSPHRGCTYADVEATGYQVGLQMINLIENGEVENVVMDRTLVDARNVAEYIE